MLDPILVFLGISSWHEGFVFLPSLADLHHIWLLILDHWFVFLLLGLIYAGMADLLAKGLGLKHIFHDDPSMFEENKGWSVIRNSPALWSQFIIVLFIALLWGFTHALGERDGKIGSLAALWPDTGFAILVSLILSLIFFALGRPAPDARQSGDLLRAFIGSVLGLVIAVLMTFLAHQFELQLKPYEHAPTYALITLSLFISVIIATQPRIIPCVALVNLLVFVAIFYALIFTIDAEWRFTGFIALFAMIYIGNSGIVRKLKFDYEGIENADGDLYGDDKRIDLNEFYAATPARSTEAANGPKLVNPLEALKAWRREFPAGPEGNPKLALVATSGGAYRASFWTGYVLDKLVQSDRAGDLSGFAKNVRLITGASGGMVTAAYFAALSNRDSQELPSIVETLEEDILTAQRRDPDNTFSHQTLFPIPRDSLAPIAQQLVQRDFLSLFSPLPQKNDRGKVLERQWLTLDKTFSDLAEGERKGWRPSLLFSPMIAETGTPLLISNLDIDKLLSQTGAERGTPASRKKHTERVIFFDWFKESQSTFKVRTAVRMNAAFPYVSPSTALPTKPYRRVVDAGYYDNYGIDMAVAYLAAPEIRDWVVQNTSGVAVIEIRAFPFEQPNKAIPASQQARQWLTTPIDAALAARGSTMTFRNWQSFTALQETYSLALTASGTGTKGHDFLQRFPFALNSETSMNWYLPKSERDMMQEELSSQDNSAMFRLLKSFW